MKTENDIGKFISDWHSAKPYINVKTSGSTGKPKTISLSKKTMEKSARLTGEFLNLKKGDRALLCLPVDFIAGKMMIVRAEVLGLELTRVSPSSDPLENIDEVFDFAAMTPMQVFNILSKKDGYDKLNGIKNLIVGGGDISGKLLQQIGKLKNRTFHTYGMTETVTHVAMKRLNGKNPDKFFKALSNVSFDTDERGCLVIAAPHISSGKIVTNDIVELHGKTSFEFKGRIDNVINTGGIKIFPETVEKKLEPYIGERFILAAIPDGKLGQKVVLVIESQKNDFDYDIFTKANLSKYETPKEIIFIQKFYETDNGKTDRKKITIECSAI